MIDAVHPRRRLLYGRRKGPKLSAHQDALRATLLPRLVLQIEPGTDPCRYFSAPVDDVWLEIGFGAGEHLVRQAEAHQGVGLLGAEPYLSGVAKLLAKLSASESLLPRVRVHEGDAREIIDALPEASLGRVFILFPDPWPKTRHHKRRFIQTDALDGMARVLKPGAEFRFASDDPGYFSWALERLVAHPAFVWCAERARDWSVRPDDWPQTRYEAKALHGPPRHLRFRRR